MASSSVTLSSALHQTIVHRTSGGIRELKVTATAKEVCVSGIAQSYYQVQLAISAVSQVLVKDILPVRFEIEVAYATKPT